MTLAEIMRAIESKKRVKKIESQEKALFDYLLADLIYRSMARIYDNNVSYPAIEEAYPAFFDAKAIERSDFGSSVAFFVDRFGRHGGDGERVFCAL